MVHFFITQTLILELPICTSDIRIIQVQHTKIHNKYRKNTELFPIHIVIHFLMGISHVRSRMSNLILSDKGTSGRCKHRWWHLVTASIWL